MVTSAFEIKIHKCDENPQAKKKTKTNQKQKQKKNQTNKEKTEDDIRNDHTETWVFNG